MKYLRFLRRRMNTKPSHGPIHFRIPALPHYSWVTWSSFGNFVGKKLINLLLSLQELESKPKERAQLVHEKKKQLTELRLRADKTVDEKFGLQHDIIASVKY
ncbi:hypothetical protein POM88_017956 [Heracleum sosnowskyi]|uniref:Uncharacterized protein n=1 Tax=Heracleum sosnowskyi TaxID=360622 RepID=A0AAD8MZX7_9APIA|nr:hypothetical protein POM88_017956 [Heracleum sosnowskyi]